MNYQETLDFLFSQLPVYQRDGKAAYKANLDNTHTIDKYFNHPHRHFKSIHVAGTNGKGSVSHMLASVLQQAGLKVGLYTSPHLKDFRERIKINGKAISQEDVIRFVEKNDNLISGIKPSFFELTVAMAFQYFAIQKVDIAVIETGMGGRLDSTNIITPMVSVITNIGLDHTQFLGNSLDKIAVEKAGIIKRGVPVVVGELNAETHKVFSDKAAGNEAPICFADQRLKINNWSIEDDYQHCIIKNEQSGTSFEYSLDLLGKYQQKNILTVLTTLELLVPILRIEKHHIVDGLKQVVKNTGLLGRWQELQKNPKIICDTAHNKEGLIWVINQLREQEYKQLHIVLGFVNDKAIDEILSMFPKDAIYYFTQAQISRALAVDDLATKGSDIGLKGASFSKVEDALLAAKTSAQPEDLIYIGGSTFVVSEVV